MLRRYTIFFIILIHIYIENNVIKTLPSLEKNIQSIGREFYIAGVVEYKPEGDPTNDSFKAIVERNLANYNKFISKAAINKVDIIVFPENGLTTSSWDQIKDFSSPENFIEVVVGVNPCFDGPPKKVLSLLSCSAKSNQIYIVVNLPEKEDTSDEHRSKVIKRYNTNVVFNRNGDIIAKYRKQHLYFTETNVSAPPDLEPTTFDTDFGVVFGTFICFDVMFFHPSKEQSISVHNYIMTTNWYDEVPFLTAPQASLLWAMSANATLLVSGYHNPSVGSLGSGIYSNLYGAINYTYHPTSKSEIVIAKIPITPYQSLNPQIDTTSLISSKPSRKHTRFVMIHENLEDYASKLLSIKTEIIENDEACYGEFCCRLSYSILPFNQSQAYFRYRLLAFNGFRKTGNGTSEFGWKVCGIVRCLDDTSINTCAKEDITGIHITPKFALINLSTDQMDIDHVMKPAFVTLDTYFQPISHSLFDMFVREVGHVQLSSSNLRETYVHTIAIIQRIYPKDHI